MSAQTKKMSRGRRRAMLKFAIAACAALGIGAAVTTATWAQDVTFGATTNVQSFQMQYSFNNSTWIAFPEGSATVTLGNIPGWLNPNTANATHSIFVRNVGAGATTVTIDPVREGVFADRAVLRVYTGLNGQTLTEHVSGTPTVSIAGTQVARIDIALTPGGLQPAPYERTGRIDIQVTGTVGSAATLPAPIAPGDLPAFVVREQ